MPFMSGNNPDVSVNPDTGVPTITVRPLPQSNVPSDGGGGLAIGNGPSAFTGAILPEPESIEDDIFPPAVSAVADDNDLESAVVQLASRRRHAEAKAWLDQVAKPPPAAAPPAAPVEPDQQQEPAQTAPAPDPEQPSFIGSIVKDVRRGVLEAPLQVIGGMRDALQSTIDLTSGLNDNPKALDVEGKRAAEGAPIHKPTKGQLPISSKIQPRSPAVSCTGSRNFSPALPWADRWRARRKPANRWRRHD